ncbi:uncharacterized protein N7459_002984 [Penicillium hispanicum]|uniref:uncharacterized protein n=1 Tax=Penicillium hispanicum TaxID=1080232 RepID=UPI002540C266|nr:uncharacterized protein N7459_002984 [Penicillium hispanicum]KAJ5587219.1 hypothetical protein N7459_002984 [Penicillium hispanicum]
MDTFQRTITSVPVFTLHTLIESISFLQHDSPSLQSALVLQGLLSEPSVGVQAFVLCRESREIHSKPESQSDLEEQAAPATPYWSSA